MKNPNEYFDWFPTKVMKINSKAILSEKNKITSELEIVTDVASNVPSVRGDTHEHKHINIPSLRKKIEDLFIDYLKESGRISKETIERRKYINVKVRIWCRRMNDGDWSTLHCHAKAVAGLIYFLEEPESGGELVFMDPRPQVRVGQWNQNSIAYKEIIPKAGEGYIFPAFLDHYVNPCKGNRLTLVANLEGYDFSSRNINTIW